MVNSFYSQAATKRILHIDDSVDDIILDEFGSSADIDLEGFMRSFTKMPLEISDVTNDMTSAANFDAALMYKISVHDYDAVKIFTDLRDQKREQIKNSFANNPQKQSFYAVKF